MAIDIHDERLILAAIAAAASQIQLLQQMDAVTLQLTVADQIERSGQRKTQRGVCSRAHGKWAGPIGYKLSRGEEGLLTGLRHGYHAHKYSRGILAWRRGHLSTLWHGDPQQNHFWGRGTWQDCLESVSNRSLADASAGLRHGIPGERPLGGIMAWRSSHLLALRP